MTEAGSPMPRNPSAATFPDGAILVEAPLHVRMRVDPVAVSVVRRLKDAGLVACLAGGCVRDLLRQVTPKDYDIATNAAPDRILGLFPGAVAIGKSFGVVQVRAGDAAFEVATFRIDHGYADGRRPTGVTFSDARHDAERRDFTVNALFYDPVSQTIADYVGGLRDLDARLIRTVGDPATRFREDRLRLMRAVRFKTTLQFALDPTTAEAVRQQAASLTDIAVERIREEFLRILTESALPGDAVRLLDDLGLLAVFLPEMTLLKSQTQPPDLHPEGDVFTHTVAALNGMVRPDVRLALAVLLHDIGKPAVAKTIEGRIRFHYHAEKGADMARAILERWRLPGDVIDDVAAMIRNHSRWIHTQEMRASTLRRLVGAPTFSLELELHRLDRMASSRDLTVYHFLDDVRKRFESEPALPAPWVDGHDLMALGVAEGPEVGRWRREAYDHQLEGRFDSRDALLDWLRTAVDRKDTPEQTE